MKDPETITLDQLALSTRAFNALRGDGCGTLADILMRTDLELARTPYIGRKTVAEISEMLARDFPEFVKWRGIDREAEINRVLFNIENNLVKLKRLLEK